MIEWKKEMTYFTILYRMLECGEQIPVMYEDTDYAFVGAELEELHAREYIDIDVENAVYQLTSNGKELCHQLLGIYDQVVKFEIFSIVNVAMTVPENMADDEGNVLDQFYDPRFQLPETPEEQDEYGTEDMRFAMIDFLCEEMATDEDPLELNPHRIAFIQLLSTGRFKNKDTWFDLKLGTLFTMIEDIVSSAYQWRDAAEDEKTARLIMQSIYTAGMLEQRKRDGMECSGCGTPLALFEMNAKDEGQELGTCPNPDCGASFKPPPPEYNCPACNAGIHSGQKTCTGCGALVDWAMPSGTIEKSTTTETVVEEESEPAWTNTYGYTPYGYYDPWDPFVNVATFGLVCAVLW